VQVRLLPQHHPAARSRAVTALELPDYFLLCQRQCPNPVLLVVGCPASRCSLG
jgi:hypothetical protein